MSGGSTAATGASENCIDLDDVVFRYGDGGEESGRFVLSIPRLSVARGERIAVIGPSGSGKSTFLSLVAGILAVDQGRVVVEGVELNRAKEAARRRFRISRVGLVFQEFELLDHLTVRENILLPYFVNAAIVLGPETETHLRALTESVGLGAYLHRHPRALSHGERQRVAICRALITKPALLLADEPTGNLDPQTARRVLDLLLAQVEKAGATFLMVTHDHSLMSSFDRVIDFESLFTRLPAAPSAERDR